MNLTDIDINYSFLKMRLLPTRIGLCREFRHVCIDRTPQPVDKDE